MFTRVASVTLVGILALTACSGGDDESTDTTTIAETPTTPAPATTAVTSTTTTTTTIAPLVTDGATVLVANASIVGGAAGRMTDELATAGFATAEATNGADGIDLEDSIVYYSDADGAQPVRRVGRRGNG